MRRRADGGPYPYRADDGRNGAFGLGRRVVRGGSWHDRPTRCRWVFRLRHPAWRKVYHVGFRVVCVAGKLRPAARRP
ncbi:MAG TPA: SUMF1/EgtB/PvdO family nonheme iron enzyme [Phycisphaerae bacterium]|nr:SUMF1/EgtB/PvdO family nonheme iron enzyme [Phycisphaerae bacterium]